MRKILGHDVTLRTSHLWIVALGAVIALGFAVNCIVYPFYEGCNPIDPEQLVYSASIVAGLGAAREFVLRKFQYLKDLDKKATDSPNPNMMAEHILKEKLWMPAIGWFLTAGFIVNMLVIPFFHQFRTINWEFLQVSIAIFLTLSGAREYGYYAHKKEESKKGEAEKTTAEQ